MHKKLIDSNIKDSKSRSSENKLPINSINSAPKTPKQKKIRALEEYTIDAMTYESGYNGPKIDLTSNITTEFINSTLIPYFKSGMTLDRKSAFSVRFHHVPINR